MKGLMNMISFLLRLIISLPLMLWAIAMLTLGFRYGSPTWLITAVITLVFATVAMVGSPLIGWLFEESSTKV